MNKIIIQPYLERDAEILLCELCRMVDAHYLEGKECNIKKIEQDIKQLRHAMRYNNREGIQLIVYKYEKIIEEIEYYY